jgi:hypothetical protein
VLVEAAIAIVVAGGGALAYLIGLRGGPAAPPPPPPDVRKEIATDLPTIISTLQDPQTAIPDLADHIQAGCGLRHALVIDIADPPVQPRAFVGSLSTTAADPDTAVRLLAQLVAGTLSTDEAPVAAQVATDTQLAVALPSADIPA